MPDIFISYSKADHALAMKLSAFLEAEGWSVWWDKSLGAADLYRDEIMKQLAAARAVITIWSPNSIKSDWVRAEAGAAKAAGKLIPVKTPDVAYPDIPLPFGEMHTENVGSTELIRAAVVGQLSKPATPLSALSQIKSMFEYQVLTWIGAVGTAVTVFANLSGVLDLADWTRVLVENWHNWNAMVWTWILGWINVQLPKDAILVLSLTMFTLLLAYPYSGFNSRVPWGFAYGVALYLGLGLVTIEMLVWLGVWLGGISLVQAARPALWLCFMVVSMGIFIWMQVGNDRMFSLLSSLLFLFIAGCFVAPLWGTEDFGGAGFVEFNIFFSWMFAVSYTPLQQLVRKLGFVVLGVLTLVGLSEISKLNLHQYLQPPKVSENSAR